MSRALFRYPVALVVAIHGLIHLMGFVTTWELAEIDELSGSTLFGLEPGEGAAQAFGLLWLLAALLFVGAAVGLIARAGWTGPLATTAAALSLLVTFVWWSDAWIGAAVSIVVLIAVVVRHRTHRPFEAPRRATVVRSPS